MGQALCSRCCCCCPCCPCTEESGRYSPDPTKPSPSPFRRNSDSTFRSFIKPNVQEKDDGSTRNQIQPGGSIRTQKPPNIVVKLEKEDNMLSGHDNQVFEGTPDDEEPKAPGFLREPSIAIYVPHPQHKQSEATPSAKVSKSSSNLSRAKKVSTYCYKPRSDQDLQVDKGQQLEVLEYKGEWAYAKTITRTGESKLGYIPTNFLANEGSLEAEDWYFGPITKLDAKRYLLQEENGTGSYLVWQEKPESYYLSVRVEQKVRHYRVHKSSNGLFYLVERASFPSVKDLVQYYSQQCDGLCTKLEKPCVKLDLPSMKSISYTTVDQLEIDPSSIQKIQRLGRGKFGTVWLGLWNGYTKVAVKELQVTPESLEKTLYGEAETMWKLSHERLLKLYAVCLQSNPVFIVTEYMPQGNLKKYLQGHQALKDLPFHQLVDFAIQITQGMKYMEQKGCVHRDLRAENVLLSAMMSCKIGDFGLARFMESTSIALTADAQIPIKWTAPEVFLMQKYTTKSDVWSFGVLLIEIFTYGKMPFPNKSNGQYRQDILNSKALEPPAESPEKISEVMRMCWRYKPESRPPFWEIEQFLMDLVNPTLGDDAVE